MIEVATDGGSQHRSFTVMNGQRGGKAREEGGNIPSAGARLTWAAAPSFCLDVTDGRTALFNLQRIESG